MDASYKIQRGIHVHLIQFFMCPEFWVHITFKNRSLFDDMQTNVHILLPEVLAFALDILSSHKNTLEQKRSLQTFLLLQSYQQIHNLHLYRNL